MKEKITKVLKGLGKIKLPKWPERLAPPGWETGDEISVYMLILMLNICWFWFVFFMHYGSMVVRHAVPVQYMPMMYVMKNTLTMSIAAVLSAWWYIKGHYDYFTKGPKGIYTMKRISDPMEIHKRCLALPITFLFVTVIISLINVAIAIALYKRNIPYGGVLVRDMEFRIWRMIICLP